MISLLINRYILTASNIVAASAFISTVFLYFAHEEWLININILTYIVMTLSIVSIIIGSTFVTNNFSRGKQNLHPKKYIYSIRSALLFSVINIAILLLFISEGLVILDFANIWGLFESILSFKSLRTNDESYGIGYINYLLNFNKAIGMVYVYILIDLIRNKLLKRKIHIIVFIMPTMLSLITSIFIGQRSYLLIIFTFIIFYFIHFYFDEKRNISLGKFAKISFVFIIFVIIFIYSFVFLGNSFGKYVGDNFISAITLYSAGGIASFNETFHYFQNAGTYIGQFSFRFFYELSNIILNTDFPTETLSGTYSNGTGLITNVYTQNLPYFVDFGILGVILLNLLIGLTIGYFKIFSKQPNDIFWKILLFYFLNKMMFIFGAEKFYVSATINIQYIIFFALIIKCNLIGKKEVK